MSAPETGSAMPAHRGQQGVYAASLPGYLIRANGRTARETLPRLPATVCFSESLQSETPALPPVHGEDRRQRTGERPDSLPASLAVCQGDRRASRSVPFSSHFTPPRPRGLSYHRFSISVLVMQSRNRCRARNTRCRSVLAEIPRRLASLSRVFIGVPSVAR